MKKILTLILATFAMTLTSCSKDDVTSQVSIENTTWEGSFKPTPTETVSVVLKFTSNTYEFTNTETGESDGTGTYTFKFPTVTMKSDDPSNTYIQEGTLVGDKMNISTPSGKILTVTKK